MRELDELLVTIKEGRDDLATKKGLEKRAVRDFDNEKERVRRELFAMTTSREGSDNWESPRPGNSGGKSGSPYPRKAEWMSGDVAALGEMDRFDLHLRKADLARAQVEKDRLQTERERMGFESAGREKNRIERRREI